MSIHRQFHGVDPKLVVGHPVDRIEVIVGEKLVPGDVIQAGDYYAASDGKWQPAPCPGVTFQEGIDTVWVRPTLPLRTGSILTRRTRV